MRMMAVYEKGTELRFVGHLDMMRAMQRALRRSGLPIRYSNGFNPHIRLSFAAPLSVGVIGLRELMEVPVEDGLREEAFMEQLNATLPGCLQIRECHAIGDDFPTLMSLVAGSRYSIRFALSQSAEKAIDALEGFMELDRYVATRRTKSGENPCDIRPFVRNASFVPEGDGGLFRLETICTSAGSLKPSLWLDSLCDYAKTEPFDRLIYRETVYARAKGGSLVPMEALVRGNVCAAGSGRA